MSELYFTECKKKDMVSDESLEIKSLYIKAQQIAYNAHQGQVDENGVPYILHPTTVSARCNSMAGKIVGMLHDVIEDTNVTYDDLRKEGFPEFIIEAIRCVTKEKNYDTKEYFERIKANSIAREVKYQDLIHNTEDIRQVFRNEQEEEMISIRTHKYYLEAEYLFDDKAVLDIDEINRLDDAYHDLKKR
ncbi:MAG: GTP pyrophosphokinase [Lachnospiraceae bacterium]